MEELVDEFVFGKVLPMKPPHDPSRGVHHVIHLRPVARELIEGKPRARIKKRRNRFFRLLSMIAKERRNRVLHRTVVASTTALFRVPAFAPPRRQNLQKVRIDLPHRGNRRPQFVILVFHLGFGKLTFTNRGHKKTLATHTHSRP